MQNDEDGPAQSRGETHLSIRRRWDLMQEAGFLVVGCFLFQ